MSLRCDGNHDDVFALLHSESDFLLRRSWIDTFQRFSALLLQFGVGQGFARKHLVTLLGLIVVEADGAVVPISYGFSRRYQICSLKTQCLNGGWQSFLHEGYPEFRQLCRVLFDEITSPGHNPLFNWHERVVTRSHSSTNLSVAAHSPAA